MKEWLQAPEGFDGRWAALHGNVVVLEFWATWCSPCVDAIPHLNQLANEFRDKGVVFLAVTDDDMDRLKGFLARNPVNAIIGIDTERKGWKAFSVSSIPHTILIDKDGHVIGATLPENVTADVLREAVAGKKPILPPIPGIASDFEWDEHYIEWLDGVKPAMYAIIKPFKTTSSGAWPSVKVMQGPSHITADGVSLVMLVQLAYGTDQYHIDWRMPKDDRTYRVAFRIPDERKIQLLPYMQHTLADFFGIRADWEKQERDLYVLRKIEGHAGPPVASTETELAEVTQGKITLRHQPISKLCDFLTDSLLAVTVDETGMNGRYDIDVPYQPGDPGVALRALKDIGLEAIKTQRNVKILVVMPEVATPDEKR